MGKGAQTGRWGGAGAAGLARWSPGASWGSPRLSAGLGLLGLGGRDQVGCSWCGKQGPLCWRLLC